MVPSTIFIDVLTKSINFLKNDFRPADKVESSVTKRTYDCIVPAGTTYLDRHSANFLYLITFRKSRLQGVGETVQKLNGRINDHKTGFRNPSKHGHCQIHCKHCTS